MARIQPYSLEEQLGWDELPVEIPRAELQARCAQVHAACAPPDDVHGTAVAHHHDALTGDAGAQWRQLRSPRADEKHRAIHRLAVPRRARGFRQIAVASG